MSEMQMRHLGYWTTICEKSLHFRMLIYNELLVSGKFYLFILENTNCTNNTLSLQSNATQSHYSANLE